MYKVDRYPLLLNLLPKYFDAECSPVHFWLSTVLSKYENIRRKSKRRSRKSGGDRGVEDQCFTTNAFRVNIRGIGIDEVNEKKIDSLIVIDTYLQMEILISPWQSLCLSFCLFFNFYIADLFAYVSKAVEWSIGWRTPLLRARLQNLSKESLRTHLDRSTIQVT